MITIYLWPNGLFASLAGVWVLLIIITHYYGAERVDSWLFTHREHLPIPFILMGIASRLLSKEEVSVHELNFGWLTLLGVAFILIGESLRVWSVGIVGAATRSKHTNAKRLVQEGPYAVIRNPIYVGNFFLYLGLACFTRSWAVTLACALYFLVIYSRIIHAEERFLLTTFGDIYRDYCQRVSSVFPRGGWSVRGLGAPFRCKELRKEYWTITGIICSALMIHLGVLLKR